MKNDIVKLTKKLIQVPSIKENSPAISKVLSIVEKELGNLDPVKYICKGSPSLLYSNKPNIIQNFKVILNAHLDVVPGNTSQYTPKIIGDKLYGRGAHDMKAGAAVAILVFKNLAKIVNYPLGLQLVTDEEIGGFNGTKYQIEKGVRTNFVISGESTGFAINNQAKGIIWIKVTAKGKSAHSAHPWDGDNAIQKINTFINKINKLYPIPSRPAWRTTQNLATIKTTNLTLNKVPDDCSASFDIRYIPKDKDIVIKQIRKILPNDLGMEILTNESCQYTNSQNLYIKCLASVIEKNTNKSTDLEPFHGASDIRHYDAVGCPGVCLGPLGYGLHTNNEWVSIKSLETYYKILESFLTNLNFSFKFTTS